MIRHCRTIVSSNGTTESICHEFYGDSLLIGRGGSSELLLEGSGVSLTHARIEYSNGSYWIEDLRSLSGLFVNGRSVLRHALRDGEELRIADHHFQIQIKSGILELHQVINPTQNVSSEERIIRSARALEAGNAMPSMRHVSWVMILLTLTLVVGYQAFSQDKITWSAGNVTSHHKTIEADCTACHTANFAKIPDRKCEACHNLTAHTELYHELGIPEQAVAGDCVSCHIEHGGQASLISSDPKLCVSCHADLSVVVPNSNVQPVINIRDHPEIQPIQDSGTIQFNHSVHLAGALKGRSGDVTLQCHDCHRLGIDGKRFEPVKMDQHCRDCHSLEYSELQPGVEAPHAEPDQVFEFLYMQNSILLLDELSDTSHRAPGVRRPGVPPQTPQQRAFIKAEVERLSREAEDLLFAKTGCQLCHMVEAKTEPPQALQSQFTVIEASIPVRWFHGADFHHRKHASIGCDGCHAGVVDSKLTSDVLMPAIAQCQDCHVDTATRGKIKSDCITCHNYHDSIPLHLRDTTFLHPTIKGAIDAIN